MHHVVSGNKQCSKILSKVEFTVRANNCPHFFVILIFTDIPIKIHRFVRISWPIDTVNVLGQYVLSDTSLAVHLFS